MDLSTPSLGSCICQRNRVNILKSAKNGETYHTDGNLGPSNWPMIGKNKENVDASCRRGNTHMSRWYNFIHQDLEGTKLLVSRSPVSDTFRL